MLNMKNVQNVLQKLQNSLEASKSFQMFFNISIEALKRFEDSLEVSVCF